MEDKDEYFKCMVCFELCDGPVECLACHKLMCCEHTRTINQTCPSCRVTPFKCQSNVPIQKIIEGMKGKLPIKCCVKDCNFKGEEEAFVQHAIEFHPEDVTNICTNDGNELEELRERRKQQLKRFSQLQQLYDSLTKDEQQNQGQNQGNQNQQNRPKKKEPTSEQLQAMKNHIQSCQNDKCFKIWGGRWGYFIGGQLGSTHFDLTRCPQGKQLNENVGWDYNHPDR